MMIFQLPIFLLPPQDLVPYAQRVVRVMGAAALDDRIRFFKHIVFKQPLL